LPMEQTFNNVCSELHPTLLEAITVEYGTTHSGHIEVGILLPEVSLSKE
jgi:hypothetical protein